MSLANFAPLLTGLGQGLMAAGNGGWGNFSPAFNQGMMGQQRIQQDALDRQERQKLRALQEQQLQMQLDAQRTANQDAETARQGWQNYLQTPGLMEGYTPEQWNYIKTLDPSQGQQLVGEQLFAQANEPKTTDDLTEFAAARNEGFQGSFLDYLTAVKKAGAPVTNITTNMGSNGINYGDPETGLAWKRNPDGSVMLENGLPVAAPYPGSKAYVAATDKETKAVNAEEQQQRAADIVLEDINRALDGVVASPTLTTGIGAQLTSGIGGTPAKDVSELVTTIRGNIGFDRLQQMRDASPTGGALGPVSDFENKNLQAVLGSLEQSQSPEQFVSNLLRLEEVYLDIIHGPGNRPAGWQKRDAGTLLGGQKKRVKFNPATGDFE